MALSEPDRLVLLEVHAKQQAWLAALEIPAMVAFAGAQPIDCDDFVGEDIRAALRLSQGRLNPGQVRRLVEELDGLPETRGRTARPGCGGYTMDQRRADALYTLRAAALADPTLPKGAAAPPASVS